MRSFKEHAADSEAHPPTALTRTMKWPHQEDRTASLLDLTWAMRTQIQELRTEGLLSPIPPMSTGSDQEQGN